MEHQILFKRIQPGKRAHLLRFSTFFGNFPVEPTDKTCSSYRRTGNNNTIIIIIIIIAFGMQLLVLNQQIKGRELKLLVQFLKTNNYIRIIVINHNILQLLHLFLRKTPQHKCTSKKQCNTLICYKNKIIAMHVTYNTKNFKKCQRLQMSSILISDKSNTRSLTSMVLLSTSLI